MEAPWVEAVDGADVVVNLAGRTVDCRYTAKNRREMMESRVDSTRALGEAIAAAGSPPGLWLQASTATIYAHSLDTPNDEASGVLGDTEGKWGFSVAIAKAWEETMYQAHVPSTVRRVALRSAMTMSPDRGGVFDVLLGLVRKGLGGKAGRGDQYVSWIHEADFQGAIRFLEEHPELDGSVNLSAPHPLPNREFMAALRRAAGVRIGLPATRWMLEVGAVFLRTETELILKSRRVVPGKLTEAGYRFRFPDWEQAAADLVERWRK